MHANILQYQFYLDKHGRRRELNRIILLTPNEGLSEQHLREFEAAGLPAELFQKDGTGLFVGQRIEILDIHKLKDEMGDKTIAIDAFAEPSVTLSSFIISNTPSHVMRLLWAVEKAAMDSRNIIFQEEDKATYICNMMRRIVAAPVG